MSDFKTVTRSQLYDSDTENENIEPSEYNLPPPGFDFEIVDIEDNYESESNSQNEEAKSETISKTELNENTTEGEKEKVEFFPLFSMPANLTNNSDDKNNNDNSENGLVKIKVTDIEDLDEYGNDGKLNDKEWDETAKERNLSARPLDYYYVETDSINDKKGYESVAVSGGTIIEWSTQFRVLSNYKVIDLKKYNSKIDLYHKSDSSKRQGKSKKRDGKKKRDAKIFKKERLHAWKQQLKEAKERAKSRKYKDYSDNKTSTKVKFGDSFNRRSNTVSKNIGRPGKPIFRTE